MIDKLKIREEKIKLLIEKGYTGNIETGKVYNKRNELIISKVANGYLRISTRMNNIAITINQHQFIYYLATGEVVEIIDHINGIKTDNRIENLRSVSQQVNQWNRNTAKGYHWNTKENIWKAQIRVNYKRINLGRYNTEEEARQAYLNAKEKYHII